MVSGEPPPRSVGPGALRALVLLVAVGVALAGWWWWTGRPREVTAAPTLVRAGTAVAGVSEVSSGVDATSSSPSAVAADARPGSGASPVVSAGASGVGGTAASALVVVHVVGTVRHPGVVRLPVGARVEDALRAAGGLRVGGGLGPVNLARVLVDGEQVVIGPDATAVPVPAAPAVPGGSRPAAATAGALVDLNTATSADLEALPRVGPVLAERIVSWRTEHGGFRSVQQLSDVPGIGDAIFAEVAPLVRV